MGGWIVQKLGVAVLIGAGFCVANNEVDWSDWDAQRGTPRSAANSSSGNASDTTLTVRRGFHGSSQYLVNQCAQRLDLHRAPCDINGNYRVPFMESGDLPCGFETRMTNRTFENLASRYAFHFVGDSTTRRLAESFISISTGVASSHEYFHARRNLTIGGLQVIFHWAPFCALEPSVGAGLDEALHEHEQEHRRDGGRRAIIVTAFGVWDATHGTRDMAALNACSDVVTRLTKVAQPTAAIEETVEHIDAPPPVVFLLQNNPFLSGSEQDHFLNDLHEVQREDVEGSDGEIYLVRDKDSIYDTMECFRMGEGIHFLDPVKLVEGKMLWDLIAIVAGIEI